VKDDRMANAEPGGEAAYDAARLEQWMTGRALGTGMSRRGMLRMLGPPGLAPAARAAPAQDGPIVKSLPAAEFRVYGSNAEMRWEVMRDHGYVVPSANFFVRNHTCTPLIDVETWSLSVSGTGLRGQSTPGNPVRFSYQDLLDMPARTVVSSIECAGNGRSFFTTQQNQTMTDTPWRLGAIGVAAWRGVPLAHVLERAGITGKAVDVMPYGLDPAYLTGGVDYGPVRRPIPVAKALDDVILAYEMNGVPLPPDSGYPVRVIVPHWAGIANIKWVGRIEVSATPLVSYWNTQAYRLFGAAYPAGGASITTMVAKSAFELGWNARLPAHRDCLLTGRSWSGHGPITRTEISTDGGRRWHRAFPRDRAAPAAWQRWEFPWRTPRPGSYALQARATDITGATQPAAVTSNTFGYLFDGIVRHPVTTV
jgi:DMSO/TMAO reductase YedYZ molybdopterin-dependent catalytic subunit